MTPKRCQPGIYLIEHISGNCYIGSSVDLSKRWSQHRRELRQGIHGNSHLQNAWAKYGEEAFVFSVLEHCEREMLLIREQEYLDEIKPHYNIGLIAGAAGTGRKHTLKTREKMSLSHTGLKHRPMSIEGKQSMRANLLLRRTIGMSGKKHSEKTRKQISDTKKNRLCTNIAWWATQKSRVAISLSSR